MSFQWRIQTREQGVIEELDEGPWDNHLEALRFGESEVGVPWRLVRIAEATGEKLAWTSWIGERTYEVGRDHIPRGPIPKRVRSLLFEIWMLDKNTWAILTDHPFTETEARQTLQTLKAQGETRLFHYQPEYRQIGRVTMRTYLAGKRPSLRRRESWMMNWAVHNAWRGAYQKLKTEDTADVWDDRGAWQILTPTQLAQLRAAIVWPA